MLANNLELNNNNNNNISDAASSSRSPLPNTNANITRFEDAFLSGVKMEISAPPSPSMRDKREKMEYNNMMLRSLRPLSYHGCLDHPHQTALTTSPQINRRHIKGGKAKELMSRRSYHKIEGSEFGVNLPRIDMELIELHLKEAREEERKRRTDREEIRRRLVLEGGVEEDKGSSRKHYLQSRLQSNMNLQICFMNETASDSESPSSDTDSQGQGTTKGGGQGQGALEDGGKYARLEAETREALAQAKEVARLGTSYTRSHSPITGMVRETLAKVGVNLPPDKRRMNRSLLTEMNGAQLQVILNDLHTHIEKLNERLVSLLLERDDLNMEQDSILVDIEDLTRYQAAKKSSGMTAAGNKK